MELTYSYRVGTTSVQLHIVVSSFPDNTELTVRIKLNDNIYPQRTIPGNGEYDIELSPLSQNTEYEAILSVGYGEGLNWEGRQVGFDFTTGSGSGGSGDNPSGGGSGSSVYFTVTNSSNGTLTLQISNLTSSECDFVKYMIQEVTDASNFHGSGNQFYPEQPYSFTNLSPGQYRISVVVFYPGASTGEEIVDNNNVLQPTVRVTGSSLTFTFTPNETNKNVFIVIHNNSGNKYYFRYYLRTNQHGGGSSETEIYDSEDQTGSFEQTINKTISDLNYQIPYALNVAYRADQNSGQSTWVYTSNPPTFILHRPVLTDGYVYIYTGYGSTGWQKAIPYIYTGYGSENGWSKAEAYIYTGSEWEKCGG